MSEPSARLTLAELMVLLAAMAVGCGICRSLAPVEMLYHEAAVTRRAGEGVTIQRQYKVGIYTTREMTVSGLPRWRGLLLYGADRLAFWPGPIVAALTLAVSILGRVRKRDTPRSGRAACLAALVAAGLAFVSQPMSLIGYGAAGPVQFDWSSWWIASWFDVPRFAGLAVAVAWLAPGPSGGRASGGGAIERIGRICGLCWIVMAATGLAAAWIRVLPR
jgi:hypothetical protein